MKIGISGSAVWSDTDRLDDLFRPDVDHIEIGMFEDLDVASRFVRRARMRGYTVGVHAPLVDGGSKYDLIEPVDMPVDDAWDQLSDELAWCRDTGVDYLLVHFPYASRSGTLTIPEVTAAARRIARLQSRFGVRVVCEPKLGDDRDPAAVGWLRTAPTRIFSDAGLTLCWDVGDHLLADGPVGSYQASFARWRHLVSVVHLHNIRFDGRRYRWTPPHPSPSAVDADYDLSPLVWALPADATVVLEYTPQPVSTAANVDTSFAYLRAVTQKDRNA